MLSVVPATLTRLTTSSDVLPVRSAAAGGSRRANTAGGPMNPVHRLAGRVEQRHGPAVAIRVCVLSRLTHWV